MITFDLERNDRHEEERLERAFERNQKLGQQHCQCHFEMPGTCPGPRNCPMCQTDDEGDEE